MVEVEGLAPPLRLGVGQLPSPNGEPRVLPLDEVPGERIELSSWASKTQVLPLNDPGMVPMGGLEPRAESAYEARRRPGTSA